MNATRRAAILVLLVIAESSGALAQGPKLVRSLSGPSGKIVGSQFEFDETRSRFVYPQDRVLTVYFEWEFAPGDHVLTATWKQPDGRVASVSPDVRIKTTSPQLNSYWIFTITPSLPAGAWTVEIRIDGQPAGTHAFELVGVGGPSDVMTLDKVFTMYGPAVVRVHKLDEAGRRFDTSSGFVFAKDAVATAFQAIDTAARVEVEFADGRRIQTDGVLAVSRLDDWAILKADTGSIAPIPLGDGSTVPVGSRLAAFGLEAGTRVVLPVSVGAVSAPSGYGTRIRFAPDVSRDSLGGPLIDDRGRVVGILGGSLTPGSRFGERAMGDNPWMWRQQPTGSTASAVADTLVVLPAEARTMPNLGASGVFTMPVRPMVEFSAGGTTTALPKDPTDRRIQEITDFSVSSDDQILVYGFWLKRRTVPKGEAVVSKGEVSATMFDPSNTSRAVSTPIKVTLKPAPDYQRVYFSWPAKGLTPGYYRIDVYWDGAPVWRVYVRVVN